MHVAAKLLELRSDVELRCSHRRTPLLLSARRGNAAVAQQLLWASADMASDALGLTPAFAAARQGHFVAALLLLKHGGEVTDAEKDGGNPLEIHAKPLNIFEEIWKKHENIMKIDGNL